MMAANPEWFGKKPTFVQHPCATLRDAVKVIRADARELRKMKMREDARVVDRVATCLLRVADGMTWAQAFELGDGKS